MKAKICGLKRMEDIRYANELMPDYAGFVFAPGKRQVTREQARAMRAELNPEIRTVGVFVDAPAEEVIGLLQEGIIDLAQLHGQESEAEILQIQKAAKKPVIRTILAAQLTEAVSLQKAVETAADYLLFDSGKGSGQAFDWTLLEKLPVNGKPFFLAGGLTPETAAAARCAVTHPDLYGLDISSGVETDGVKDYEKIKAFLQQTRKVL